MRRRPRANAGCSRIDADDARCVGRGEPVDVDELHDLSLGGREGAECVGQRLSQPGRIDPRLEPRIVILVQQMAAPDCGGECGGTLLFPPLGRGGVGGDAEQPGRRVSPGGVVPRRRADHLDERLRDGVREIIGSAAPSSEESRDRVDVTQIEGPKRLSVLAESRKELGVGGLAVHLHEIGTSAPGATPGIAMT